MTTISATIIEDSINVSDEHDPHRLTTVRCRYPRWIHAEGRTHRQLRIGEQEFDDWHPRTPSPMEDPNLSRNASSSRAIPVKKMIEAIRQDPAVPIYWGANQKGMQAGEEIDELVEIGNRIRTREEAWLYGMEESIALAEAFDKAGYHKQIINRLLESWMHIEVLFTATEWSNYFALRIHKAAEPHICLLATRTKEAMDKSIPRILNPGEWHLPYVTEPERKSGIGNPSLLRLSVARCAHLSYETVGTGELIDHATAARIYDQLLGSTPIHASPAEHQGQTDSYATSLINPTGGFWQHADQHANFKGWRQYRKMIPGECQ